MLAGLISVPVSAAEIEEPEGYSLGSTSEFSAYEDVSADSASTSDALADTGMSWSQYLAAGFLLAGTGVVILIRQKNQMTTKGKHSVQ